MQYLLVYCSHCGNPFGALRDHEGLLITLCPNCGKGGEANIGESSDLVGGKNIVVG